jgi:anti-sigma factor RsiW
MMGAMSEGHDMNCQDARASIQAYLDGELNEERAGPLRKHLLDCQPCRGSAQSEKNLKRWFTKAKTPAANLVPRDFSARVARRAFAGDPGERFAEPRMVLVDGAGGTMAATPRADERNLRLVLSLTAAAAVLLAVLSVAMSGLHLPSSSSMLAEPKISVEDARQQLDQLNHPAAAVPPAATKAPEKRQ